MALDVTGMDPDELEELLRSAQNEKTRRSSRDEAERRMDEALLDRLNIEGLAPGSPWEQPEGPSSAYPREFIVAWGEGFYRSKVSVNTERPDVVTHWDPVEIEPALPSPDDDGSGSEDEDAAQDTSPATS